MRTAIKITLNSSDVFDAVILDYIVDKKNKAGQLKKLIYDSIMQQRSTGTVNHTVPPSHQQPAGTQQDEGEKEVSEKISKMLNF
ncbi:MAG: hypothetical protein AB1325_14085 [Nitrospirota bacterium]